MHLRFLTWLFVGALLAVVSLRAQVPGTAGAPGGPGKFDEEGLVLVAKVSGNVSMVLEGATTALKVNDRVPQKAKIITAKNASVVLVFSNGATTQLGTDTELVIDEFLQDPFADSIKVAELSDEPTPSRTKLSLNRGELVGNVKKLKYERGSSFTVQTPVGAAGIRGTTFRIVFRPSGTGQAFFTLSTASGIVAFEQPNAGGGTTTGAGGTPPAPAPADGTPTPPASPSQPTVTGSGSAAVSVPQGQELVIVDVQVTTNAQGQMVVTVLPPPPSSTTVISSANMQAVAQVASDIAVAVQQTVFTPAPPAPTPGTTPGSTGNSGDTGPSTGTSPSGSTTGSTTGTTQSQSQTSTVSGSNFTGQVTTTPPAPSTPPPAVRQSTVTTEP